MVSWPIILLRLLNSNIARNQRQVMLNEDSVKTKLIDYLISTNPGLLGGSSVLANELIFLEGKRKADIVEINREYLHVFEIKSDIDNLVKLESQITDYRKIFDYITIVTTEKNIKNVTRICPKKVGIIMVNNNHLEEIRKPLKYISKNKIALSSIMDREDLRIYLGSTINRTSESRKKLSKTFSVDTLEVITREILLRKHSKPFEIFIKYRSGMTLSDDLEHLSL